MDWFKDKLKVITAKSKRAWEGLLLHIPVGLVIVFFASWIIWLPLHAGVVGIIIAVLLFRSFMRYEEVQGGDPHLDIKGLCHGLWLGGLGLLIYLLVG